MERPAKRLRLDAPLDNTYRSGFPGNQDAYYDAQYDIPDDQVDEVVDHERPEEETEDVSHQDLARKRARVQFKLKSTFESIFEKYEKDFDGIGDEIDMRTGEVVVNNGHLLGMRHEMDPGEQSFSEEDLEDYISGPEEEEDDVMEIPGDYEGLQDDDDDEEEEDSEEEDKGHYGEEDPLSDGDMDEDDLILRGFAQASQQIMYRRAPLGPQISRDLPRFHAETQGSRHFMQDLHSQRSEPFRDRHAVQTVHEPSQHPLHRQRALDPGPSRQTFLEQAEPHFAAGPKVTFAGDTLPSRSEILAQFGPQLGPEIATYVSENKSSRDIRIEPAWRVPDIVPGVVPEALAPPARRQLLKPFAHRPEPEPECSTSPDNAPSVWAVEGPKATRNRFSQAEDQLLQDFAADARRRGLNLTTLATWRQLEEIAPRHTGHTWKDRYVRKFTYLQSKQQDDADLSTTETSESTGQLLDKRPEFPKSENTSSARGRQLGNSAGFARPAPPRIPRPIDPQRPARTRTQLAHRDGIVSWPEAVATIASIDPEENAALLDDAHRTAGSTFETSQPSSVYTSYTASSPSQNEHASSSRLPFGHGLQRANQPTAAGIPSLSQDKPAVDQPAPQDHILAEEVACPHANCRPYPTTLYRLERRHNEQLSPLCSHLLCEHRIAPFPCGEAGCERRGTRGYFLQKDLVWHVVGAHPHAEALNRLRGRVDSIFLYRNPSNVDLRTANQCHRTSVLGQQAGYSNFMSPPEDTSLGEPFAAQHNSVRFEEDKENPKNSEVLTSASNAASSMHVGPPSVTAKDTSLRAASSDSDVQMLDDNPFLNQAAPSNDAISVVDSIGAANVAIVEPRLQGPTPISPPRPNTVMACAYPGCQTRMGHINDMIAHLRSHATLSELPLSDAQSEVTKRPLPSTILDSQSSATLSSAAALPKDVDSSSAPQNTKSTRHVTETFVNRSYELSDDEDGIRPVIGKPPPQASFGENLSSRSQPSFGSLPVKPTKPITQLDVHSSLPAFSPEMKLSPQSTIILASPAAVAEGEPSQLSPKVKRSTALRKSSSALPKEGPSLKSKHPSTPAARGRVGRSLLGNVLDSEDFDELSMSENGFVLLSARPKAKPLFNSVLQIRVKSEQPEHQSASNSSGARRKRRFSILEADSEADELGEAGPSTPNRLAPIPVSKNRRKTIAGKSNNAIARPIKIPKSRKSLGSGLKVESDSTIIVEPDSTIVVSLPRTPTKQTRLPTRTSTPLMDLVPRDKPRRRKRKSKQEIPSTSEMGSSPATNAGRAASTLQVLITPYKEEWADKLKEEGDDDIVTPGGTSRRCGQNGFVCGRAFCFKCRSEDGMGT